MTPPTMHACTCVHSERRDVVFFLHTAVPERDLFVSTVWFKYDSPDPARRLVGQCARYAKTIVMPLRAQRCWECGGWRWCGDASIPGPYINRPGGTVEHRATMREGRLSTRSYDPDHVTEGGLGEAHQYTVAQVKEGAFS